MKKSVHAKRMERHHRRNRSSSKLNLVSLMDIFTILVFFLLVNSSDVEVLQNDKSITLPDSVAEKKPAETLVVVVSKENILVGGRKVSDINALKKDANKNIVGLKAELDYRASRKPFRTPEAEKKGRSVNILADKDTPYTLLKSVMATSARSGYRKISLAVSQVASDVEPVPVQDTEAGG